MRPPLRALLEIFGMAIIVALLVALLSQQASSRARPSSPLEFDVLTNLQTYWFANLRPPALTERPVVYCSGPLFNLSEVLYAVGWKGLLPPSTSLEELNGLNEAQLTEVASVAEKLGLNPYGACGELAEQGMDAYVPARDGFTLAVIIAAIEQDASLPELEKLRLMGYMSKAIYSIDAFCLGGLCNCGLFNANGLQIDDGSATEVGMMGMRGMPIVIYRDQATSQIGPGVQNPMPIGNASSTLSPTGYPTVQLAVAALRTKLANIVNSRPAWQGSAQYSHEVPPPPLYIYWQSIGEAVFMTKFRSKQIVVNAHGQLNTHASYTPFFFERFQSNPSVQNIVEVAQKVAQAIQQVERRFEGLAQLYPEAMALPSGTASYGI